VVTVIVYAHEGSGARRLSGGETVFPCVPPQTKVQPKPQTKQQTRYKQQTKQHRSSGRQGSGRMRKSSSSAKAEVEAREEAATRDDGSAERGSTAMEAATVHGGVAAEAAADSPSRMRSRMVALPGSLCEGLADKYERGPQYTSRRD
jgi:hypothetical protein